MAGPKRSPILGYNTNILHRGLIFHVQTEDSGVANPHVFTHLFHGGVIISTRKLVYDVDSGEEAVKSLMKAQQKAVLKELKRGSFDDKIDIYLAGTPGLLPRGSSAEESVASAVSANAAAEEAKLAEEAGAAPTMDMGGAPEPVPSIDTTPTPAPAHVAAPVLGAPELSRTGRPNRASIRPDRDTEVNSPTPASIAALASGAAGQVQLVDEAAEMDLPPLRGSVPVAHRLEDVTMPMAAVMAAQPVRKQRAPDDVDASTMTGLGKAGPGANKPLISGAAPGSQTRATTGMPVIPSPTSDSGRAHGEVPRATTSRPAIAVPAAVPARQSMSAPVVVSRPIDDAPRAPTRPSQAMAAVSGIIGGDLDDDQGAAEVYSPAPPSADAPPGVNPTRAGQYAQHRPSAPALPRTGRISGAPPMGSSPSTSNPGFGGSASNPFGPSASHPGFSANPPASGHAATAQVAVPTPVHDEPSRPSVPRMPTSTSGPTGNNDGRPRARTSTQVRMPTANPSPSAAHAGTRPNNVVVSKPAVVVGNKPAVVVGGPPPRPPSTSQTVPRVRRAREDESARPMVTEKSLDEVILAYLSEDGSDD